MTSFAQLQKGKLPCEELTVLIKFFIFELY